MSGVHMTKPDVFFDTNILLHAFDSDVTKAARTYDLLTIGGVVSVQVLNEFANVALRKWKCGWPEIKEMLEAIRANCLVVPITVEVHERGLAYAERHQLSIYDSFIVAAAVLAGCATLYSEDMNDGQVIDGVKVNNPYRA